MMCVLILAIAICQRTIAFVIDKVPFIGIIIIFTLLALKFRNNFIKITIAFTMFTVRLTVSWPKTGLWGV